MKKALSLILTLVLCLSLCACGNNGDAAGTSVVPTAETDPLAFLYGSWISNSHWESGYGFVFYEGGNFKDTLALLEGNWSVEGNVLVTTADWYHDPTYKIVQANGTYYLVNKDRTLVKEDEMDIVPKKTIQLTIDNWQDYFYIDVETYEIEDQFGELTGEVLKETYLKIKDSYRLLHGEYTEGVLIRYRANGAEVDCDTGIRGKALIKEGLTMDQIEMVKIKGSITYLDGV